MSNSSVSSSSSSKYASTVFYKIVCKDASVRDIYVGHTIDIHKRMIHHKSRCNKPNNKDHNMPVYKFIREHGGWDNWEVVIIECCECCDFTQAKYKEREYIETLNASLNLKIPIRDTEEVREYKHNWHRENIERIHAQKREKYIANRDDTLNKCKQFYNDNKEKINEWQSTLVDCSCGKQYTKSNKARHMKSKFHIDNSSD